MGRSALDLDGLTCGEMPISQVEALPQRFGTAATQARRAGFTGVEVHAAHGFLLSQFLSPLFNHRQDRYGGSIEASAQLLLDIVDRVRHDTGPDFAIGVKINATDELVPGHLLTGHRTVRTAWYTMRLTAIAQGRASTYQLAPHVALDQYDSRDGRRLSSWQNEF